MNRRLFGLLFIAVLLLAGCERGKESGADDRSTVRVAVSLFPYYDLARRVGGDAVEVHLLLPWGASPHGYEPTPRDIQVVQSAQYVIYTSDELEPWMGRLTRGLPDEVKVLTLEDVAGRGLHPHEEEHAGEDDHEASEGNHHAPHLWLDPLTLAALARAYAEELVQAVPDREEEIRSRLSAYLEGLEVLDRRMEELVDAAPRRTVVFAGHRMLDAWAARYGVQVIYPFESASPSAEVLPRQVREVLGHVLEEEDAPGVLYEAVSEVRLGGFLEAEGIAVYPFYGLHTLPKEMADEGYGYVEVWEMNLASLRKVLYGATD
ncbi:ABC-type metal ion transporter, periplasmic subunit [Spirochaeta thermophila DSM 6578]|uniref:ABC-type metal ion transporter, periplasmic subunit n=1 Tax=Winmispira thermophila (strain ATCC 700085 / DSM 6578 / Z-1203) TaxID=869211 RepID=G0GA78_WINT7|nr:metal ABC transporter substrate-binding protein [Spirochaeta thermophila]AEJ60914.1 ABC-type metal ion transporter, periplasmic subunit [Spirochaeta thermophila DSM 6578]